MKAQHPPHIPWNSLAVTEYFRSLPQSWEAAVATTRRWWHPGGLQLQFTIHQCLEMQKK